MRVPNQEDWPLSLRTVAGPKAAPRTRFHDTDSAEGITTFFLPVPCGAGVLPLFESGVPNHKCSRRFPLTLRLLPNRPQPFRSQAQLQTLLKSGS